MLAQQAHMAYDYWIQVLLGSAAFKTVVSKFSSQESQILINFPGDSEAVSTHHTWRKNTKVNV